MVIHQKQLQPWLLKYDAGFFFGAIRYMKNIGTPREKWGEREGPFNLHEISIYILSDLSLDPIDEVQQQRTPEQSQTNYTESTFFSIGPPISAIKVSEVDILFPKLLKIFCISPWPIWVTRKVENACLGPDFFKCQIRIRTVLSAWQTPTHPSKPFSNIFATKYHSPY
jgi:hypothetical protein